MATWVSLGLLGPQWSSAKHGFHEIFFKPEFDHGNPSTPSPKFHPRLPPIQPPASSLTSPTSLHDPSALAHSLPVLEKLSHHVDTLELHLVHEIARHNALLCALQPPRSPGRVCAQFARLLTLCTKLEDVGRQGLRSVQREVRLAHMREAQAGVRAIRSVVETVDIARGPIDGHEWGTALDSVDDLRGMWDSAPAMAPSVPSRSPLPSVAEEELPGGLQEKGRAAAAAPVLDIPLSKLKVFAALRVRLAGNYVITYLRPSDLVIGLAERRCMGQNLRESPAVWTERVRVAIFKPEDTRTRVPWVMYIVVITDANTSQTVPRHLKTGRASLGLMLYPLSSSTLSLPLTQFPKTQICRLQDSGGLVIAFATASSHHLHTSRHASTQLASPAVPTPQPAAHAYVRRPSRCRHLAALGPTQLRPPAPASVTTSPQPQRHHTRTRTRYPDPDPATSTLSRHPDPATTTTLTRPPPPPRPHYETSTSAAHLDPHWRRLDTVPTTTSTPASLPPTRFPSIFMLVLW
ncbi:hypothetical protein EDB83DRAFT_2549250 [Lactarius deliciosus]|nr:hypothetical protein EDB83DRAFT_2549250 [Lactarius deliciosus]